MTTEEAANVDEPEYPRNVEVMWVVPRDGRKHVDTTLLAEARKLVAPQLTDDEKATPVGPTSIIEHFAHEVNGRLVDPKVEPVTIYAQLFTVEAKDSKPSSKET
jgi:hypothetical protein